MPSDAAQQPLVVLLLLRCRWRVISLNGGRRETGEGVGAMLKWVVFQTEARWTSDDTRGYCVGQAGDPCHRPTGCKRLRTTTRHDI